MIGRKRSGVFLSYSRSDGEEFAKALRRRLSESAPDIRIMRDREILEGGEGWRNQIKDAIESVEFVVLVMTPAGIRSAEVQFEWRFAREQGVCIYPVKAAPDSELQFSQLPRWMSKAHFFDIEKEWETFLAHLRKGCDTPRVLFMAPELPDSSVKRPVELGRVKNLLFNTNGTVALLGGGGFGKTTLANALCHELDIIQNFDDGVLWVELGRNPDVLRSLANIYASLTGERPGFVSEDDCPSRKFGSD